MAGLTPQRFDRAALIAELKRDEGVVRHAYQDHLGYWTIGVGRLIDERRGGGISLAEAEMLLDNDVARLEAELDKRIPWWRQASDARQRALLNMAFQLGIGGLMKFRNTLARARADDWAGAAAGALNSLWARQTPARAQRIAEMLKAG